MRISESKDLNESVYDMSETTFMVGRVSEGILGRVAVGLYANVHKRERWTMS
jgi:hypothetical protein